MILKNTIKLHSMPYAVSFNKVFITFKTLPYTL